MLLKDPHHFRHLSLTRTNVSVSCCHYDDIDDDNDHDDNRDWQDDEGAVWPDASNEGNDEENEENPTQDSNQADASTLNINMTYDSWEMTSVPNIWEIIFVPNIC